MLTWISGILIIGLSGYLLYKQIFKKISEHEELIVVPVLDKKAEDMIMPMIYSEYAFHEGEKKEVYFIRVKDIDEMIQVEYDEFKRLSIGSLIKLKIKSKTYVFKWFWGEPKMFTRTSYLLKS